MWDCIEQRWIEESLWNGLSSTARFVYISRARMFKNCISVSLNFPENFSSFHQIPRGELNKHLKEDTYQHLELVLSSFAKFKKEMFDQLAQRGQKQAKLKVCKRCSSVYEVDDNDQFSCMYHPSVSWLFFNVTQEMDRSIRSSMKTASEISKKSWR